MYKLTAHFDDGPVVYRIVSAAFTLASGQLQLAVEAASDGEVDSSPQQILFAVNKVPFSGKESVIEVAPVGDEQFDDYSISRAYLYADFHATHVGATIEVVAYRPGRKLKIRFAVQTDNLDSYEPNARSNKITGECVLTKAKATATLWCPAPYESKASKRSAKPSAAAKHKLTLRGTPVLKRCNPKILIHRAPLLGVTLYGENLDRGAQVQISSSQVDEQHGIEIQHIHYESSKRIDVGISDERAPCEIPWTVRVINNNGQEAILESAFLLRNS